MWNGEGFLVNSEERIRKKSVALATESPRLGVAEAPPFRKGGFDAAKLRRLPSYKNYITKTINQYFYEGISC